MYQSVYQGLVVEALVLLMISPNGKASNTDVSNDTV